MKDWFKFVGLSFFSDKIAKQGVKRGYFTAILCFVVAFVILICGVIAADLLPFPAHYGAAGEFKEFLYNAFADGENAVDVLLENELAGTAEGRVIDTISDEDAAAKYKINGYNLVIDTRPADAFDDFIPYCLANDGTGDRITYEEYLNLSDAAKRNFDFKVEYTPRELVLTPELTEKHESFLSGLKSENAVAAEYTALKNKKGELSKEEYAKRAYTLFVKAYYPSMTAYERTGSAPLLRNYYYHNYSQKAGKAYFYLFSDTCTGCFNTDAGHTVQFYGFYGGMANGRLGGTQSAVDEFIKSAFYNTSNVSVYVYAMNFIRLVPFIVLMPVVIALLAYCILSLIKSNISKKYGGCFKIVASFLLFASLITALCTFVCGYFVSRNNLFILALVLFFVVTLVRTCVLIIMEKINLKKNPPKTDKEDEVFAEVQNDFMRG